jgi:ABC-type dipeptide/oligopeptide/nickel transport system ATPase subunit
MSALDIADLSVWFGEGADRVDAVREVSFGVERGDSFGLVGESGSGKSTVLRAIAGLAPDWSGAWRWRARRWGAGAAPPSTARCRWCSRTPTPRCIRAIPSTRC